VTKKKQSTGPSSFMDIMNALASGKLPKDHAPSRPKKYKLGKLDLSVVRESDIQLLYDLKSAWDSWREVDNELRSLYGLFTCEGKLGQAHQQALALLVKSVAVVIGTSYDDLDWFIYDCKWGQGSCNTVGMNGVEYKITSIRDYLAWVAFCKKDSE
jgi:hypothetical protein